MALEIREIVVRAVAGVDHGSTKKKKDDSKDCEENKDSRSKQETIELFSDLLKNKKER